MMFVVEASRGEERHVYGPRAIGSEIEDGNLISN